jgi:4-deoxy-L-threo-5-hexosulose-uronate ketol-isomerase
MKTQLRYSHHPDDFRQYDTTRIREEFLVETIFEKETICLVYSLYDRFLVGGAMPVTSVPELKSFDALKSPEFLARRELGIINVGGPAVITIGEEKFALDYKEALYAGKDSGRVTFSSKNPDQPAKLYFNSAPAHHAYPTRKITLAEAEIVHTGTPETSNQRTINKLLVNSVIETCGLQMGLTELHSGSVWNTMPPHTHSRRMEAYFYFALPQDQAICHFMGQPQETRHIWMHNEQAVISPPWSIHSAAGTSGYAFIWGMTGENLDYGDMDVCPPQNLK